jgi:hypothetical protein
MISKLEVCSRRLVKLIDGLDNEEFALLRAAEETIDEYIENGQGNMHILPICKVFDSFGKDIDSEISRKIILALLCKYEVAGWKIGIKDDALILE